MNSTKSYQNFAKWIFGLLKYTGAKSSRLSKNMFHYRFKFSTFRSGSDLDRNKTFRRPQTEDVNARFRGFEDNLELLLNRCKSELAGLPPPLPRKWRKSPDLFQKISMFYYDHGWPGSKPIQLKIFQDKLVRFKHI